jgi:hypothetical protein
MAKAQKLEKTIIEETVTLTLTKEEAQALLAVTGLISGSTESPRKHTSAVHFALVGAGVRDAFSRHLESGSGMRFLASPRSSSFTV